MDVGELERWRWPLVATSVAIGVTIVGVSRHYLKIQRASDVQTFRRLVAMDGADRVRVAACVDAVFAASYVAAATTFARHGWLAVAGIATVAVAALCDEVENGYVLVGASRLDRVTDATISTMRSFGRVKSVAFAVGFVLVAGGAIVDRLGD